VVVATTFEAPLARPGTLKEHAPNVCVPGEQLLGAQVLDCPVHVPLLHVADPLPV
jgi:hypothetical protein